MNTRQEISDELREWASPLADMPHAMPYTVPYAYFDTVTLNILTAAKAAELADIELIWTHQLPFDVPKNYFKQLPAQILAGIREQDATTGLPSNNPLHVPEGYFEALPQQILATVTKEEKVKRVSLNGFWRQLRWAAAALLICSIGLGSYKLFAPVTIAPIANPQQALNKLPATTIHEYIQQNIDDYDVDAIIANANPNTVQALTKQLDQQEIQEYLDATGWGQPE